MRANPPTASRPGPHLRQQGAVVLYLVMGLVLFGVLAAASSSYFSSAVRGVLAPNCTTASRMMAESGLRYAAARLRAAGTQAQLDAAILAMNGTSYDVDAAKGLRFTISIGYDGLGNLLVGSTGRGCNLSLPVNSSTESVSVNVPNVGAQPPGSGISFAGGDTPGFTPTSVIGGSGVIVVDSAAGTITLGGNIDEGSGAVWYSGTKDLCSNGNCTLGTGLRAYYEFNFNPSSNGDGFVWTLMSANTNTNASSGGDPSMGELMGYGGPGAQGKGIQPPKFGVEFDIYDNTGTGSACNVGNRGDATNNADHMAFIYWGTTNLTCSGKTQPTTYDDNRHGAGLGTEDQPMNSQDSGGDGAGNYGYYYRSSGSSGANGRDWLQDGGLHKFRYEMVRSQTANAEGNYAYKLRAWVKRSTDSFPTGLDNTTADYDAPPDMWWSLTLSPAQHANMNKIFFGWTEGTGAETQLVTLSKFGLNFRGDEGTVPTDYSAGWAFGEGSGNSVANMVSGIAAASIAGSGTTWYSGGSCSICRALIFNTSGYVTSAADSSQDLTTAGTVAAWVRVDSFVDDAGIVHKGRQTNFSDEAYSLQFSTNRRIQLALRNSSGGTSTLDSRPLPNTTGVWRHVAATWDASSRKIYIDGVLSSSANSGYTARTTGGNLLIGAQAHTNGGSARYGLDGGVDQVYLYKRALTAAEIAALATNRP